METTKIALFKGKKIRKIIHDNEWWFSVIDVIKALTDSVNPRDYWFKMKIRVKEESGFEASTICRQLKLPAPDGKMRDTDCADTEGIFRIIQSIPSPKDCLSAADINYAKSSFTIKKIICKKKQPQI